MAPPGAGGPPLGYEPYAPLRAQFQRPAVILWFRVWAATTFLLYVGFLAFLALWQSATPDDTAHPVFYGGLAFLALILGGLLLVGALAPYKPWGWTAGLVAICFGLASFTAPFAIALLVYWLKPTTRAAFGRL